MISQDEHGGFYDSVPPPTKGVPNPGDGYAPHPPHMDFDFKRLGLRIPTLLVSPWVNKGTVIHEPTDPGGLGTAPTPTSQFELSSLPATVKQLYGLKNFLTKRDEWAGTFEKVFEARDAPRTDCPKTLPAPPNGARADGTLPPAAAAREAALPLNGLQRHIVSTFLGLEARDGAGYEDADAATRSLAAAQARGDAPARQGDVAAWLRPRMEAFRRGELL